MYVSEISTQSSIQKSLEKSRLNIINFEHFFIEKLKGYMP